MSEGSVHIDKFVAMPHSFACATADKLHSAHSLPATSGGTERFNSKTYAADLCVM